MENKKPFFGGGGGRVIFWNYTFSINNSYFLCFLASLLHPDHIVILLFLYSWAIHITFIQQLV